MPNCLNMTRTSTQKPPLLSVTLLILFYLLIVLKKTPFDVTMYVCVSCMSFSAFNFDVDQLCVIKRRVMENYHFSVCPCLLLIFAVANRSGTTCASCLWNLQQYGLLAHFYHIHRHLSSGNQWMVLPTHSWVLTFTLCCSRVWPVFFPLKYILYNQKLVLDH